MRHDQNPPELDKKSGLDNKSKRKERQDRLAASLRENLLRRKSQTRARKADGAADQATAPPSVDLEAEGIVHDTGAATGADR
jgi:hypothetical protein